MKHLEGIRSFKTTAWKELAGLYAQLTSGQTPFAFVLTCSDSRYYPELVMQTRPGDLFCLRNAGNMFLPYNQENPNEGAATLEFAVNVLNIEQVVIMGHYGCGLVEAALKRPQCVCGLKALQLWIDQTKHAHVGNWNELDASKQVELSRAACRAHLVHQLDNMKTHPCIINSTKVQLHGLIFDMGTGVVEEYDPDTGAFVAVEATA